MYVCMYVKKKKSILLLIPTHLSFRLPTSTISINTPQAVVATMDTIYSLVICSNDKPNDDKE